MNIVILTVRLITKTKLDKKGFAKKAEEGMRNRGLILIKMIPYDPDTTLYFWTQQCFLIATISCSLAFVIINAKFNGKLSILSSMIFALIPIIEILPPVFVWYEYNTVSNLAVDPVQWVSISLIVSASLKLLNHVITIFLLMRTEKSGERSMLTKIFKIIVEHKILHSFFLKAFEVMLVYFYFSRFLVHGSPVSNSTYISLLCSFVTYLPKMIKVMMQVLNKLLKTGCVKENIDFAENQKVIQQKGSDYAWAPIAQGALTVLLTVSKFSIVLCVFVIYVNDYIIDFCIEVDQKHKMNDSICAQVDDNSLSVKQINNFSFNIF
ncbi:Oidioi.mRNA.OKI2018_I69.chr2.g4331.t1.cds [Oikopleura dioica]|uniref:Oidioi.mRNA.OKI2018_I69.chr2.g4331.t1.cds n=1 Tax=Oikopleura dioica TaxID=34765 RepID=A0ABN7T2G2_OIKDI|nr:Oidioi.mRNA.OKI2018_I69.chr2.g4331.t1.cds [Oikopleura dioica]